MSNGRDEAAVFFLIDAFSENREGKPIIKLRLYDAALKTIKELLISGYSPYFLLNYPLSGGEEKIVDELHGETEIVWKRDLFANEMKKLVKVKVKDPATLRRVEKKFDKVWEYEIDFAKGYIYDHGLVFGAPYKVENDRLSPVWNVTSDLRERFKAKFAEMKAKDPLKYAQLEYWFTLFYQPIPQIELKLLGLKSEKVFDPKIYIIRFMLARIVNIPVAEALQSHSVSDWIKSMIYSYLRKHGILIPNYKELRRGRETRSVPGALTITPKSGIYFNTVVCDFESLYPSCIDSFNLSYETVDCVHEECKANSVPMLNHYVCTKRRGFYSVLVGALKDLRIHWFKSLSKDSSLNGEERELADIVSKMLKLIAVSSYGVTVRIHGLASPPLAECITGYGRYALEITWKIAEENGMRPIYGDTDSIFLDNPELSQVEWLIKNVRDKLHLDLAMEKQYSICVLSKAKKAYFGVFQNGEPDIKGLTVIKSNSPRFFHKVFMNCVKELANVKDSEGFEEAKKRIAVVVQQSIEDLKLHKVPLEDLVYRVRLYFDPHEKTIRSKVLPQPYQCALQLLDNGEKVAKRDVIGFVKVRPFEYRSRTFTVKPLGKVRSIKEINVADYIRNLITALNQTFEPMGIRLSEEKETKITEWLGANS
jgi:DNA polymerase elongation subunit (family B)